MSTVDEGEHPQTSCSNCHTVFEVSVELLASSDTRVRCGECLSIFDALTNLREDEQFNEDDDFLVDTDGNIIERPEVKAATVKENPDTENDSIIKAVVEKEGDVQRHKAGEDTETGSREEASVEAPKKQAELTDAGAAALAGLSNDTEQLEVTYSDFSLFSEEDDIPEVAYFDQTQDDTEYQYDADETFNDTLFTQDMTIDMPGAIAEESAANEVTAIALNKEVDFVTNDSQRDPIVFKYRDKEPMEEIVKQKNSVSDIDAMIERVRSGIPSIPAVNPGTARMRGPWVMRSSLAALVLLLAGLLYGYKERHNLLGSPVFRPVLTGACVVLPCTVPAYVDISAFKTVKRAAFSHPNIKNALIIDLAFINEAAFSQPHPLLELKLTDVTGRLVVQNKFAPADYLDQWQDGDQLDSGERINVSLTVEDPGRDVTSFMVAFH